MQSAMNNVYFKETTVLTPVGTEYNGLAPIGETSAVVILRAGSVFETGLKRGPKLDPSFLGPHSNIKHSSTRLSNRTSINPIQCANWRTGATLSQAPGEYRDTR
jgi:uracil phosphoribosyltransferase